MNGLGRMIGGAIAIGGMLMMADIMIGSTRRIPGEIVGESRTHYHVRLHRGGRPPGHKKHKRKGEIVKVRKS